MTGVFRTDEIEQKFEDIIGTGLPTRPSKSKKKKSISLRKCFKTIMLNHLIAKVSLKTGTQEGWKEVWIGQVYSYKSWLRRVFTTNIALEPKPSTSDRFPKDYLHSWFKWCRLIPFDQSRRRQVTMNPRRTSLPTGCLPFLASSAKGNIVQANLQNFMYRHS